MPGGQQHIVPDNRRRPVIALARPTAGPRSQRSGALAVQQELVGELRPTAAICQRLATPVLIYEIIIVDRNPRDSRGFLSTIVSAAPSGTAAAAAGACGAKVA
jgi:hypothetical protein